MPWRHDRPALVAAILAVGLAVAIDVLALVVLYGAMAGPVVGRVDDLSDNGAQVLVAAFGGIVGVLGAYIGYTAGRRHDDDESA